MFDWQIHVQLNDMAQQIRETKITLTTNNLWLNEWFILWFYQVSMQIFLIFFSKLGRFKFSLIQNDKKVKFARGARQKLTPLVFEIILEFNFSPKSKKPIKN